MPKVNIEFDSQLSTLYSIEGLNTKKIKLGFYKKDKNTYVLTTSNARNGSSLETNIKKILDVIKLNDISISFPQDPSNADFAKSVQYLDSFGKFIERHNEKAAAKLDKSFFSFLNKIPLINRLVKWCFFDLQQPTNFIDKVIDEQKRNILSQFEKAESIPALAAFKDKLLSEVKDAKEAQKQIRGIGMGETWNHEEKMIQDVYEDQLVQKSESLRKAKQIVTMECQEPKKTYREMLGLNDDSDLEAAPGVCNALLKELTLDAVIAPLVPDSLKSKLETKAKELVINAYGQWQAQRILNLYKVNENPSFKSVLGIENPGEFIKRFKSLSDRLNGVQPPVSEAINKLKLACENYFEGRVETLVKEFNDAGAVFNDEYVQKYQLLLKELEGAQPVTSQAIQKLKTAYEGFYGAYIKSEEGKLMESLSSGQSIFAKAEGLKQVLAINEEKWILIKKWSQVIEKEMPKGEFDDLVAKHNRRLTAAYEKEIQRRVPVYAEACRLLGLQQESENGQLFLTAPESISNPALGELWFELKKFSFESNMVDLDRANLSTEVLKTIDKAYQEIISNYGKLKVKQQQEAANKSQPSKSFFQRLFGGSIGDSGVNYPLNMYKQNLLNLLNLNDKADPEQVKVAYDSKLELLKSLPNTKEVISDLEEANARYEKAQRLQPILKEVSNSHGFFASKMQLDFADLFPGMDEKTELLKIENEKDKLIQFIDEEIAIQTQKGEKKILRTLEEAKVIINQRWSDCLKRNYPIYERISQLLEIVKANKSEEHYYKTILQGHDLSSKVVPAVMTEKNAALLSIAIPNIEMQPQSLQRDFLKASQWIETAYKEWEADRILLVSSNSSYKGEIGSDRKRTVQLAIASVLGFNSDAVKDFKTRYYNLHRALHPDKYPTDLPQKLKDKFEASDKVLSDAWSYWDAIK